MYQAESSGSGEFRPIVGPAKPIEIFAEETI